jgi:hypothetical protein
VAKNPQSISDQQYRDLIKRTGLTPAEMREDPELGMLISTSGARKLAAVVPDTAKKMRFLAWLQATFPERG